MNGPGLVCAGCGKPTTLFKPVCDECMRIQAPPSKHMVKRYCLDTNSFMGVVEHQDGDYISARDYLSLVAMLRAAKEDWERGRENDVYHAICAALEPYGKP